MTQDLLVLFTTVAAGAYLFRAFFAPSFLRPRRPDVPVKNLVRRRVK